MRPPPHIGWRPAPPPPPPPLDANGWGRWVSASIAHMGVEIHYLRQHHDLCATQRALDAPTSQQPATWADRRELAKDIASALKDIRTGLMWIAVIIVLLGLIAKKLDLTQLQTLKSWLVTPG